MTANGPEFLIAVLTTATVSIVLAEILAHIWTRYRRSQWWK